MAKPLTYAQAGVDIDEGEAFVKTIKGLCRKTHGPRVLDAYGGFAGLFRLDYDENLFRHNYRRPVLVAATDGVGTKLKIAFQMKKLDTIGIDLAAMCLNDLIVVGAEPLFFLDYLATAKLDRKQAVQVLAGLSRACLACDCALLGGETAEMPGFYRPGELDLAGFAVGVVERHKIRPSRNIQPGDTVVGLASDGLHSNGFSLARKVVEQSGVGLDETISEFGRSLGEEMLRPTRLYVKPILQLLRRYKVKRVVKGLAHITGGGLPGNLPRVLPKGLGVQIRRDAWDPPPIFRWLGEQGPIDDEEMFRVFNMGVGFCLIVAPDFTRSIMAFLRRQGEQVFCLGKVRRNEGQVELK